MKKYNNFTLLQRYIETNYERWRQEYSDNLHGVHIGKKKRKGSDLNYYSIVFHVTKKDPSIEPQIPRYIKCRIGDSETIEIPTDVSEESELKLYGLDLGDRARNKFDASYGRIGAFLRNGVDVYACSNMHVLAPSLLAGETTYYENPRATQLSPDIALGPPASDAFLERCVFDGIDAGIARLADSSAVSGMIQPGGIHPAGYKILSWSNYRNYPVKMPMSDSTIQDGIVQGIGIIKSTSIPGISLRDLIKVTLAASPGDSGSPVYDSNNMLIGMLFGGTDTYNLLIPIAAILNYFQMNLF